jgi:hypothetical protein
MANENRAYLQLITLLACAASALACAAGESLRPDQSVPDGAALGGGGNHGGGGASEPPDAGEPPEAGDFSGGPGGAAGDPASGGAIGTNLDAGDEAAPASPPADAAPPPGPVTYEAESGALFGTAAKVACATCSNGQRVSIGADSGVTFSGVVAPESGTNTLIIYYSNADSINRSIYVGVNGGDSQMLLAVFPPSGGAGNVSSIALPLSGFNAGSNNTLMFFIDTELGAPDLDRIGLAPSTVVTGNRSACDHRTWRATASVTGGDGGGPAAGIDGDLTTRWANNRGQNGSDWYQVDFGALVKLARITLDDSKTFPDDYPGSYAVFASLDGVKFDAKPFVTGNGTRGATVIDFAQRTVRAIKITQVGSALASRWWQIGELQTVCYQ